MTIILCLAIYVASIFGARLAIKEMFLNREFKENSYPSLFAVIFVFIPMLNSFVSLILLIEKCDNRDTSRFFGLKRKE